MSAVKRITFANDSRDLHFGSPFHVFYTFIIHLIAVFVNDELPFFSPGVGKLFKKAKKIEKTIDKIAFYGYNNSCRILGNRKRGGNFDPGYAPNASRRG